MNFDFEICSEIQLIFSKAVMELGRWLGQGSACSASLGLWVGILTIQVRKTGVGHVSVMSVLGGGHRNTGVEHVPVMSEVRRQEQKNRCGAHACNASAGKVETNWFPVSLNQLVLPSQWVLDSGGDPVLSKTLRQWQRKIPTWHQASVHMYQIAHVHTYSVHTYTCICNIRTKQPHYL